MKQKMNGVFNYRICLMSSRCRIIPLVQRFYSNDFEKKFTDSQKEKILQVINEDSGSLSRYEISKARLRKLSDWLGKNGQIQAISDIKSVDTFTEKLAMKLCNSILDGPKVENNNLIKSIKGQILQPSLSESIRQSCKSVVAVDITVNSVCWVQINKENYEVNEWKYYNIDYPNAKKLQITDILDIAWDITKRLPVADIYVMKAEARSLRASGSDPNNPKVLGVNLQKAQLVAMIVALINAKNIDVKLSSNSEETTQDFTQRVYFLRPTLPYRLYGTLVGNEHVSTEQTVENLLQEASQEKTTSHVNVPVRIVTMFRNQKDLRKDMLGQCLLLALTFMDICIYLNKESITKLLKRGE
ncbi:uncharacterized protein LOC126774326 [Nymphalis io]|uniref:uncharacterized protein LOC126774326 n=1 Tax=Inachis io TaxID=171585 RepID=UPI0021674309|nr:uncharacterized protein LOC126774326 [Nymphalis io]